MAVHHSSSAPEGVSDRRESATDATVRGGRGC